MSWQDRTQNIEFTITTGDGKVFKPLWMNGEKSVDYNVSEFDYIDVEGTEVERKKPKSGKFPLVFYFQGDDNIEQVNDFETSAKDPRFWTVNHPFYGQITGQPTGLKRNDNNYNVTEVTVDFWESIDTKLPKSTVAPRERVQALTMSHAGIVANNTASLPVASTDVRTANSHVEKTTARLGNTVTQAEENYNDFQLLVNDAQAKANNLLESVSDYQLALNELLQFPTTVVNNINYKLELYGQMFQDIIDILNGGSRNDRVYFESAGSFLITSLANSIINPNPNDYTVRNDVVLASQFLQDIFTQYNTLLDASQTDGVTNTFGSSFVIQNSLNNIVSLALANLFTLAFAARQERTVIVDRDTNLIILVHKYIGLDIDDKNIEDFRQINNIKNRSLFKIKKGTVIKYFV